MVSKSDLKSRFETNDIPTQQDFSDLIDETYNTTSEYIDDENGFTDGNSIVYKKNKRLHLQTDERWIESQGHLSDLIRLQWHPRTDGAGAKPALVWADENNDDRAAIIAHDLANNPEDPPHRHISIETTMSPWGTYPNQLFTRLEIPWDVDVAEIQTHSSNFTVNGGINGVASGEGQYKDFKIRKYIDNNEFEDRWAIRGNSELETGGNEGTNFEIVNYTDEGQAMGAVIFAKRNNGYVGVGTNNPTRKLDVNGRLRIRESKTPNTATSIGYKGDIAWDSDYIYVCIEDNTWKRTPLQTW